MSKAAASKAPTGRVQVDQTGVKSKCVQVTLEGTRDIMFDRYAGDNNTKLEPHQKMYLSPADGGHQIILPALNIMSLLSAHNTNSAPKRLRDSRQFKKSANALLSFYAVRESSLPFLRDGKPIIFGRFDSSERDAMSGVYVHRAVARLDKGIPNPKIRPVLPLPWGLTFSIEITANKEITEQEALNLLEDAGKAIGLGTFRGVFGKFRVLDWVDL